MILPSYESNELERQSEEPLIEIEIASRGFECRMCHARMQSSRRGRDYKGQYDRNTNIKY
jgi:hypothetical protein